MASAENCRREARQYYRRAARALTPQAQELFHGIARTWDRVADQIEALKGLEAEIARPAVGSPRMTLQGDSLH